MTYITCSFPESKRAPALPLLSSFVTKALGSSTSVKNQSGKNTQVVKSGVVTDGKDSNKKDGKENSPVGKTCSNKQKGKTTQVGSLRHNQLSSKNEGLKGGANPNDGNDSSFEVKGYKNRLNDCFVNASGIILLNLEPFKTLIERYGENALLQEFKKSQNKEDLISIRSLVKSPDAKLDWIPQDQQDAAEFISAVLQTLIDSREIDGNEIKNIFQVKYQKEIICNYQMTQDTSEPPVEEYFLHVPVKSTLDEAFEIANKDEEKTITVGTETFCSKRAYQRSPDVLMFQFTRMLGNAKNENPVNIPLTWNPTKITGPYKLKGAIVHEGPSVTSGHYYALINKRGKYYCVNDTVVSELTCDQFLQKLRNSYLVFFEKTSQESLDDGADQIGNPNKTPPSSPTALSELKRKLMDTKEVKKQQKKDTHCQFCSSEQDRTTLIAHLQSHEFCRICYLRLYRTDSLSDVKVLALDPCFACDNVGFKQTSRHLKSNENCLKEYKEHFNVETHNEVMTKIAKLKEKMKPSRGKKARHEQNKKENEKKRENISVVDCINNYRQNISLANYRTCVKCFGNYLDSGALELKEFQANSINLDLKTLRETKKDLQRMKTFWICNSCYDEEDNISEKLFVSPKTLGYKDFHGRRRVFYPIFDNDEECIEATDEAEINRTNANKIISILVPSSVEALKLSKNKKVYQSDSMIMPRLSASQEPVTLEDLKDCYSVIYSKYWRREKYCSTVITNNYDTNKKILYSVKNKVDVSVLHGSDDWENHNAQNIVHRFDQLGHMALHINIKVDMSNIECFATSKILEGEYVTEDFQGEANKEKRTIYWLHHKNSKGKMNLSAHFNPSDHRNENSKQKVSTFVSSLFQRSSNFVQHIVKNQSTEIRSDDYYFGTSFDRNGDAYINGVMWPLNLDDINKEMHYSSYDDHNVSEAIKLETFNFLARNLSTSSDQNDLKDQLDLTEDEAADLVELVNTHQKDLQRNDPPLPTLKYLWCEKELCNPNKLSAESLIVFMTRNLINLSTEEKENLTTVEWLSSLIGKAIKLQVTNTSIDVKLPNESIKFQIDDKLTVKIEEFKQDQILSRWSNFIGLYHYCISISFDELVVTKRTQLIESFTKMFNPLILRAVRSPVEVLPVFGNFPTKVNCPYLANEESMSSSNAALTALSSHSEISLNELFQRIDSRKGRIESSRSVQFVNSSPNRKQLFRKINKKDKNENSFTCEGNDYEFFDQVFDVITRHNERLNGQQLLLVETASYYNTMTKEQSKLYFENFHEKLETIPEDDNYNHKSVLDGKPLPKYILCKNKHVLELRKCRSIVSYPIFDDGTHDSRFSRVLLYYPLKPGVNPANLDIGNDINFERI